MFQPCLDLMTKEYDISVPPESGRSLYILITLLLNYVLILCGEVGF